MSEQVPNINNNGATLGAFGVQNTQQTPHALARMTRYETYRQLYSGDHWLTKAKPGERRIVVNYCRVFVNKAASYLFGKPVGYEAFVPGAADPHGGDEGRAVEQYLQEVAEFNQLAALDLDTAISAGTFGDGAFTVRWDKEAAIPRVTSVDVRGLDARWRQDDLRTLTWVRQRFFVAPVELAEDQLLRYLTSGANTGPASLYEPVEAFEEWTAKAWKLTVGGVVVDEGANPYEEIP